MLKENETFGFLSFLIKRLVQLHHFRKRCHKNPWGKIRNKNLEWSCGNRLETENTSNQRKFAGLYLSSVEERDPWFIRTLSNCTQHSQAKRKKSQHPEYTTSCLSAEELVLCPCYFRSWLGGIRKSPLSLSPISSTFELTWNIKEQTKEQPSYCKFS